MCVVGQGELETSQVARDSRGVTSRAGSRARDCDCPPFSTQSSSSVLSRFGFLLLLHNAEMLLPVPSMGESRTEDVGCGKPHVTVNASPSLLYVCVLAKMFWLYI